MTALPIAVDDLDQRLLLALIADPLASFASIAGSVGSSTATVSSRVRRLQRRGLLRVVGRTLPGFGGRHAYLVRATSAPVTITRFATTVAAYDNTRWVRVSKDGSELMCGLVTESPDDDPILAHLPSESQLRTLTVYELIHVWGGRADLTTRASVMVDQLDEALLSQLAVNGRTELRSLAADLGVNASTVSRRRQRLIDAGVLYFEADVHPDTLGGTGDAMLWMTLPPGRIRSAGSSLRADTRVRFTAATSGPHDLVAHVQVGDNHALLEFVDETLAEFGVAAAEIVPMGRVLKRNAV